MNQLLSVVDDKLVVDKIRLNKTEGSVTHYGNINILGSSSVEHDLTVNGSITVDTLHVKNLVSENSGSADAGQWVANLEDHLTGKGFSWTWGEGRVELSYQHGNRLRLSGGNLDLSPESSYRIDNTEVVTLNALGPTVTKSNLKELGALKSLNVIGDSLISEFAYFASGFGRLGLNTDEPNGTLSIVDNDVEFVISSPAYGTAQLGTYTNHDVSIITDNTSRLVVKNDGKVIFGDVNTKTADVTIYGTLNVETLVADTRVERFSSLEIKSSRETNVYGKGIVWTGGGTDRQLVIMPDPDRLWSSEPIDLAEGNCYFINKRPVLSENSLGDSILHSKLSSVGDLETLTVKGESNFLYTVNVKNTDLVVSRNNETLTLSGTNITSNTNISLNVIGGSAFYADSNEITVGNKNNSRKPVKMFGPVSIGISNTEDADADFTVKGNIKFSGKKFITGAEAPKEGSFNKGDICWNEDPKLYSYVGWVCTAGGIPGVWLPFGEIGK